MHHLISGINFLSHSATPVLLYWVLVLVLDVYLSTFVRYWYWYWYCSLMYWYLYWYLLVEYSNSRKCQSCRYPGKEAKAIGKLHCKAASPISNWE